MNTSIPVLAIETERKIGEKERESQEKSISFGNKKILT